MTEPVHDLRLHAAADPERTAIVCAGERLSYGALEALANRCAAVLRSLGLQRGEHVATLLSNRIEALALVWAAWRSGVYLTPMPTTLVPAELRYLADDCDARVVIADAALADQAAPLPASIDRPVHWLSLHGAIAGYTPMEPLIAQASPEPAADETPGALMMYTSGTTGAPKGVIRPLLPPGYRGTPPFAADLIALIGLAGPDVRYLSPAPLYHAAPLRFSLAVTAGGGTVHVMPRFDAAAALHLLQAEGITHSQWVPAMFQRLLALPDEQRAAFHAPSHRVAVHAAAPCPPALKRRMIDWWGPILLEYYAGSEGVGMTIIDSHEALQRPGSVGRARRGVLHIVDEAGRELPPGQTGRIYFSGLTPFAYHKAPEKTATRTLQGAAGQAWQTLGDIGHVDADGYLYLTDRQDDMIISGGVNLYPQEIEAALAVVPGVADCAAVGVPDERFGEKPVAYVVAAPGVPADALRARIDTHLAQQLGKLKRPAELFVVDELPRSATGKLLRRVLRERYAAAASGAATG